MFSFHTSHHVDFWQARYDALKTGEPLPWDLQGPSPHVMDWLNLPPGRMIVPGAGRGHEAALFARHGFQVTAVDYAPGAVETAQLLYGDLMPASLDYQQADLLTLADNPAYLESFDYWLEHTCFCAIPRSKRGAYIETAAVLLKPGGLLLGIFWHHADPDGPPFSTTPEEVKPLFADAFVMESMMPVAQNAGGRSGQEYQVRLKKS